MLESIRRPTFASRAAGRYRKEVHHAQSRAALHCPGVTMLALLGGVAGAHDNNPDRRGSVWVVNRDRGELTIFDAATGAARATIPTGAGAHEVAISRRARQAYVTNETAGTISIVSTRTLAKRDLTLAPGPHHVEPSRGGGRKLVVGLVGSNEVALVDSRTDQIRRYFSSDNPAARAHSGYIGRHTIYVPHETGNEVTGIDIATGTIEFSITGIVQASEVLPDRREHLLYVSARGEGKVKVIDLASETVVDEVSVGTGPETMLLTRDGRTLIVTLRGTPAQLAFVDTRSLSVIETVPSREPGPSATSPRCRGMGASSTRPSIAPQPESAASPSSTSGLDRWSTPGTTPRPGGSTESRSRRKGCGSAAGGRAGQPALPSAGQAEAASKARRCSSEKSTKVTRSICGWGSSPPLVVSSAIRAARSTGNR